MEKILNNLKLDFVQENNGVYLIKDKAFFVHDTRSKINQHNLYLEYAHRGIKLFQLTNQIDEIKLTNFVKSKLLIHTEKLYARRCEVDWITQSEFNVILNAYHIQGKANCHYSVGIKHNGELIGGMGFNRSKFGWLLCRLVFTDKAVVGGAGKMLNFFREFSDLPIETFSNTAYSDGGIYSTLGFVCTKTNKSDMWYVDPTGKLLNRRKYQKKNLPDILPVFDASKTEVENMLANGYDVFYGAGTKRWELDTSAKQYFIYKLTNTINGKIYIGKTHQPQVRFEQHKRSAVTGKTRLYTAMRKHGIDAFLFEVLHACDRADANDWEQRYIEQFNCCVLDGCNGYNMTRGGDGFDSESSSFFVNERTAAGNNPFSKNNGGDLMSKAINKRRIADGTHNFLSIEHRARISDTQKKLIESGAHLFLDGSKSSETQKTRIADGTHHILSSEFKEKNKQLAAAQIADGTHNFTKEISCPVCGHTGKGTVMTRWHFDNCGKKKETWNDGIKNYTVIAGQEQPHWVRGMVPRKKK